MFSSKPTREETPARPAISRRHFLGMTTLAAGAVLAACGQSAAPAASSAASVASSGGAASSAPSASAAASSSGAPKPTASAPAASGATSRQGSLTVTYAAGTALILPLWLADVRHAFEQHNLAVKINPINQANAMLAAMVAKEVDVALTSGPDVINADLNSNVGLVFVASVMEHATFALMSLASVKDAADLKGKRIASGHVGTAGDYMLRSALPLLGLKPSDVTILELGNNQVVYQALQSGQVEAGILSPPESLLAESKGFRVLQDTYSVPYQSNGAVALQSRLNELAPVLPAFLAGLKDGINAFNNQPELAMQTLQQKTKVDDPAVLKQTYDFYRTKAPFNATLQPSVGSIQSMLDFIGQSEPKAKTASPQQFLDMRFLK